jgi:hypothetical protein
MDEAPATTDTLTKQLQKRIAKLQGDLVLLEANRADITIALLTKPDDAEIKAQLEKNVKEIETWRVALEGAAGALVVAQSRDLKVEHEEAEAARQQTAAEARALMAESLKIAQQIDKSVDALAAALVRMNDTNRRISRLSYDTGVRGEQRHNLLSIRHAGGVLAARLITSGLYDQLDFVEVRRPPFLDTAYGEIAKGNADRLDSWIDRALSGA